MAPAFDSDLEFKVKYWLKFGTRTKFDSLFNNVKMVSVTVTLTEKNEIEMRSMFRGHNISIGIAAFRLASAMTIAALEAIASLTGKTLTVLESFIISAVFVSDFDCTDDES